MSPHVQAVNIDKMKGRLILEDGVPWMKFDEFGIGIKPARLPDELSDKIRPNQAAEVKVAYGQGPTPGSGEFYVTEVVSTVPLHTSVGRVVNTFQEATMAQSEPDLKIRNEIHFARKHHTCCYTVRFNEAGHLHYGAANFRTSDIRQAVAYDNGNEVECDWEIQEDIVLKGNGYETRTVPISVVVGIRPAPPAGAE